MILNVKQAFDRVWNEELLFKLKAILETPFYLLLKYYLSERTFYIKIDDENPDICDMKSGVPQVSWVLFYAPYDASVLVQRELNMLQIWLEKLKIEIKIPKCNYVTFILRRKESPSLYFNGSAVPKTDTVKYLGLHFDKRLIWKNLIMAKRKSLNIKQKEYKLCYVLSQNLV